MPRFQGDLPERTFLFADAVLDLVEQIPNVPVCWVAIRQLSGRGTSVGANVCEADDALTSAEFTSICNIARREARETQYWLRLCRPRKYRSGS